MYEDTAVRCMTTMYIWLTNIGSFWIISIYIGHSAGIVGIIKDLWNMKSTLVTNLFWVTWSPSVSRWRVSFCFTVKSYTLLYTNNNLKFNSNILRSICTSNWKIKIRLSDLSSIATVRGPTLPVNLYTKGYFFSSLMSLSCMDSLMWVWKTFSYGFNEIAIVWMLIGWSS